MARLSREDIPWWLKIAAKIVLSRLPVPYRRWQAIGIFKHGKMLDPKYAIEVFCRHLERSGRLLPDGYIVLELGPGDSLATSVVAAAHGAGGTFLVDVGAFASMDVELYNRLIDALRENGPSLISLAWFGSVPEMLRETRTTYLTNGLEGLRSLPSDSVDFIFSDSVLEHVRLADFTGLVRELYRVQKPGGVSSHSIDLQDHLEHGLNSLRFSRAVWESRFFSRSGFYTNRLRAGQIADIFSGAGYNILLNREEVWDSLPIRREKLHEDYRDLPEKELLICGLHLVACKRT